MKRAFARIAICFLLLSFFTIFPVSIPIVHASQPLTIQPGILIRSFVTPTIVFQGRALGWMNATYFFLPNGQYLYFNNQTGSGFGNLTALAPQAKWGSLPSFVPLNTHTIWSNSTTVAYHFVNNVGGNTADVWYYLKQKMSATNFTSSDLKVTIVGTLSASGTIRLPFVNMGGGNARTETSRAFFGGVGFDWSDSISFNPTWDSALNQLSYPVGTSFTIDPSTVTTVTTRFATNQENEGLTCTSNGRHWIMFVATSNSQFTSSTDGVTWLTPSTFSSAQNSGLTGVWCASGNKVHYAVASNTNAASFKYRNGTLNADGTITWPLSESTVTTTGITSNPIMITLDSNNNPWVAVTTNQNAGTTNHIEVYYLNLGIWTLSKDINFGSTSNSLASIVALTAGKMTLFHNPTNSGFGMTVDTCSGIGCTWSMHVANESSGVNYFWNNNAQAVTLGSDTVYMSVTENGPKFDFLKYINGGTSITKTILVSGAGPGSISSDNSRVLAVAYNAAGSTSELDEKVSYDSGVTWTSPSIISTSESFLNPNDIPPWIDSSFSITSGTYDLIWVNTAGASPWNLRYATVSPFATEKVTITVSNSGPTGTATISGCNPSTGTILMDNAQHTFTSDGSCSGVTITMPTDAANTRYRLSPLSTTWTLPTTTTPGGTDTRTNTTYYQLQNTYQATPATVWDGHYLLPVNGTILGVAGTTGCNINTSNNGGSANCASWFDYNLAVTITPSSFSNAAGTGTWKSTNNVFTDTTGGNTDTANYAFTASLPSGGGGSSVWYITTTTTVSGNPPPSYSPYQALLATISANPTVSFLMGQTQGYIPIILVLFLVVIYLLWREIKKKRTEEERRRNRKYQQDKSSSTEEERYNGSFSKGFPKY